MKNKTSLWAFYAACLLILATAFSYPKWQFKGNDTTLSWDVTGYYLYLPATFIYKDLGKLSFKDQMMETYNPAPEFYHAVPLANGNHVMKYPVGLAIQMFPSFLIGLVAAKIFGYPIDGFSFPFQFCVSLGSLLIAFIGLWFCRKILLRYFDDRSTAVSLLVLAFATNYLNYTAIDGAMTHNYLFTLYAILIWLSIRWHERPAWTTSIAIGAIVGLATITRPVEIISFLIPLAWGMRGPEAIFERLQFLLQHWKKLILAVLATILVGSIQLLYWKYYSGEWLFYSYEDQRFNWRTPHPEVIFSYRKGWLTYTPVMIFAVLGLPVLLWKNKRLFWVCFGYFVLNLYIVSCWPVWWYGGSFGQRALVQSYTMLSIPLTAFIAFVWQKNWSKYLMGAALLFFAWLNLMQTYQIHAKNGGMEADMMTEAYYWRIFGKTSTPITDRKLLDTDEDYNGKREKVQTLFQTSYEDYPIANNLKDMEVHSGQKAVFLNHDYQIAPLIRIPAAQIQGNWIRASAYFFAPWKEWETLKMPQMMIHFRTADQIIKSKMIRLHRILPLNQHTKIWMDAKVPEAAFDYVEVDIYMADSRTHLHIDDLKVESFDEP